MDIEQRVFLFIIAICSAQAFTVKQPNEAISIQYVTNVTRFINVQQQHTGIFICWLLQISEQRFPSYHMRNSLAKALSKEEGSVLLQADLHTPYSPAFPFPNLVLIFADVLDEAVNVTNLRGWLDAIPYKAVVVILFKATDKPELMVDVADNFLSYSIVNLILVAFNEDRIYTFHYAPTRSVQHVGLPHPSLMLYDRLNESKLRTVTVQYAKSSFTYSGDTGLGGEDIRLFKLFFERLAMAIIFEETVCDRNQSFVQCLAKSNSYLFVNRFAFRTFSTQLVNAIEMDKLLIFAPKGKQLTFSQMLLKPFDPAVWILLTSLFVAVYLLCRLAPNLIYNDLVLLALVGVEKRSLLMAGRFEKLLAISLIVLFFQLKCAYETKLMSYMVDIPTEPDPKTVADLRQRNCKVLVDSKFFDRKQLREPLAGVMHETDNQTSSQFDDAFLTSGIGMRLMLKDVVTIDPASGRQRYITLEETLGDSMPFFYFHKKCPFQQGFETFLRAVFEAGLQRHWRAMIITHYDRQLKMVMTSTMQQTVGSSTLEPVFIFTILQWVIAVCVFLCELIVCYAPKWCRKLVTKRYRD